MGSLLLAETTGGELELDVRAPQEWMAAKMLDS